MEKGSFSKMNSEKHRRKIEGCDFSSTLFEFDVLEEQKAFLSIKFDLANIKTPTA